MFIFKEKRPDDSDLQPKLKKLLAALSVCPVSKLAAPSVPAGR